MAPSGGQTPSPPPLLAPPPPSLVPPARMPVEPISGASQDDLFSGYGNTAVYASAAGPPGEPPGSAPPPAPPLVPPPPAPLDGPDLALPEEGITMHSGSSPELPHWTDPPTGEVPRILPDRELAPDEELSAWQALGSRGLRWRDEASDWDDMSDVSELADGEARLGALDTTRTEHSDMFSFDEQFERLEDERSGQHVALERDLEPPPAAPAFQRPQPAAPGPAPRRPIRRAGGPGQGNHRGPAPRGPSGGGRDLGAAMLVGGGLLVVLLICYVAGSAALVVLATLVVTASALELYNLIQHRGFRPATLLGLAATVALMLAAYWRGEQALPLILALVFITTALWYMLGVVEARPVVNIGLTLMAFVWVGVFGSYASLILRVHHGKSILLLPILVTVTADTVAFFAGSSIGQRPLAPAISPGKTWEGAGAGGFAAIVVSVIVSKLFLSNTWNLKQAFVLGLVVAVIAPIGDLCESMVKRDLDLKDSGTALPGHGGLLDRFDTLLFVLPAAYYLAQYLKLH
jgi:phosphatidate cytidylyltransferase